MKRILNIAILGITFLLSTAHISQNWIVKENAYRVSFKGDKMSGTFKELKATITFDLANLAASKIAAAIDASSVDTDNRLKNRHARAGLEADEYPTIKFESTAIVKKENGYEATGNPILSAQ